MADKVTVTFNGKEYKYGGVVGLYLRTCVTAATFGGIVGASLGLAAGIASPVLAGMAIRRMIHSVRRRTS